MYEHLIKRPDLLAQLGSSTRDKLLDRQGSYQQFVQGHELHAASIAAGSTQAGQILPRLWNRFAHEKMLFAAAQDVRIKHGAPGPDGERLGDLSRTAQWSLARALRDALRSSSYRPGPTRAARISKGEGRGHRQLEIQNVQDRIVDRALLRTLQPVIDPTFSSFSFGFRPQTGITTALAAGVALARKTRSWFWVSGDVANAFTAIPQSRLLDACRQYLPEEIVQIINVITTGDERRGLGQGSPISPFLANVFFHHFLDLPWARRNCRNPLFRYADDLAVLGHSRSQAEDLHAGLEVLARSAGTPLKKVETTGIFDIRGGQRVTWLGFQLQREQNKLAIRISETAWSSLADTLFEAHLHPAAPIRAREAVHGWIDQMGPCYPFEDLQAVARRIGAVAAEAAFEEMPTPEKLIAFWQRARARWQQIYLRQVAKLNDASLPNTANAAA